MFKKLSTLFVILAFIGCSGVFASAETNKQKKKQDAYFKNVEVNVPHINKTNLKVWTSAWEIYGLLIKFDKETETIYQDEILTPHEDDEHECDC
tara:strand:+ start:1057 stop:1338 length:282 start_codon:yes stop_codon:yes gene_type:complete